jgi:hypothetical protein
MEEVRAMRLWLNRLLKPFGYGIVKFVQSKEYPGIVHHVMEDDPPGPRELGLVRTIDPDGNPTDEWQRGELRS